MRNTWLNLSTKIKLFYPVLVALALAIIFFTVSMILVFRASVNEIVLNDMQLEVQTIKKMFERERQLKLEKVKTDLKVAHDLFYKKSFKRSGKKIVVEAENQFSGNKFNTKINIWERDGKKIYGNTTFPDYCFSLFGGTTTIFQKVDSGYLRISTNVPRSNGKPAIGTFIPNSSEVAATIDRREVYYGRAFVVNDWYITAYEPIMDDGNIVGALYVGSKEKDIDKLSSILTKLKLGKDGFISVIDSDGDFVLVDDNSAPLLKDSTLLYNIMQNNSWSGLYDYHSQNNTTEFIISSALHHGFAFHIIAGIPSNELTHTAINKIYTNSFLVGSFLLIILTITLLSITTRRVMRLLNAIKLSNVKLKSTKEALKQSEENFETIFQSSSDEIFVSDLQGNILELNVQASNLLGYSREELLQMNILDLKPLKHAESFLINRKRIMQEGGHMFDSEYITKDGQIIPVEINSRLIEFNGEKVILSISRNLLKRKEMERKVLSVVIQTEEKERERFSKDMHDGIGPLLSTVKLYVNELGTSELAETERKTFVEQVNKMLDDAVASIREISNNLMPRVIHEYGLVKALEAFCKKVNQTGKIHVDFKTIGIDASLDKNVQLILFRVISELLTNTIKHANAKNAYIQLQKSNENISLEFSDNGIGFNSKEVMENKNTGIGLKSIVSRIKSINGSCDIESESGKGFKILIEI